MTAAVSDYRVASPSSSKLKKAALGDHSTIELVQNPDILKKVSSRNERGIVVGFAAETLSDEAELEREAKDKLQRKGCDLLVANDVSEGRTFDQDDSHVLIVSPIDATVSMGGSKAEIANAILDRIAELTASN
jgi:phosphopantothenoylcysteine decarboxylase/phosphopantothenate--cysteine ligase